MRRADRWLRPYRRSARAGAKRMGARRGRRTAGGARPQPAGGRARRPWLRRGARSGGSLGAAAVGRAARRPLGVGGRGAGAGAGAAARLRSVAGLRALPGDRPLSALHRPAVLGRPRRDEPGVSLVWSGRCRAALCALRLGCGARCRGGGAAHRRRAWPGVPGDRGDHLGRGSGGVRGRRSAGVGGRHAWRGTVRIRRVWGGAVAGQLGAAGPSGSARGRRHFATVDGRGSVGAGPRRRTGW